MTYEPMSGLSLGAVERFRPQHYVRSQGTPAMGKLGVELEWISPRDHIANTSATQKYHGPTMRSPIVRGAPYTSMMYLQATPRVFVQRTLSGPMVVDNDPSIIVPDCGQGFGVFSETPVLVQSELRFHLDTSDATWLLFVSEPTEFICSTTAGTDAGGGEPPPPGVVGPALPVEDGPAFELRAVSPMQRGMVRVAVANNCTTGQNPQCKAV